MQCRDILQGDLQTPARLGSELEEQKAHLSELFARIPEAVVLADRDSRILRVNPEFTKLLIRCEGWQPETFASAQARPSTSARS